MTDSPDFPPPVSAAPASSEPPPPPPVSAPADPWAGSRVSAPTTEGTAVAALVCAILSWLVVPIILAVVALVLARNAERAITARPTELTGLGLVSGARWVAWIHLVLAAMLIAFLSAFAIALWIGR